MHAGLLAFCCRIEESGCLDAELLRHFFSISFSFKFFRVRIPFLDSMDEGDAIIDISSDEENAVDGSFDISEEWLNELLETVDVEVLKDLDDVVVADELCTQSCMKKPSPLQKESDEDCLILDGDPDKVVSVVNGYSDSADGCADLLIIGEKGHLACRDYPHSRHLCAIFPFRSTPHEKHCNLCHCYVCDSLAPCIYWGYGLSTTDHCHASEEELDWKSLRNYFKLVVTEDSESLSLSGSRQSNSQPFRSSQDIHHPWPGLSNTLHQSPTTGSTATIPDPSIQREHQLLCSSLGGLRTLPVSRGTRRFIGSGQRHSTSIQRLLYSKVLQGSQRGPLAITQSMQPEVSNNLEIIQGILDSIEADLFGTDYNSAGMEQISSASSLYPALSNAS